MDPHLAPAVARAARTECLHCAPLVTPTTFYAQRRWLLTGVVAVFSLLAVAARFDHGAVLLTWDRPIQLGVEGLRTPTLDSVVLAVSALGSTKVVLTIGPLLALLAWRRCRAVAIAVLVATFARPLIEWTIKEVVSRDRPDFERLVPGNGPSFPSGHVLAAVALWGLLPLVVALFTRRRALWWASVAASALLITGITASRVYLGVHWFSDVIGGLLFGSLFLVAVEWLHHRVHRDQHGCLHP